MRQYKDQSFTQHYFNQPSQDTQQYFPIKWKLAGYMFHLQSAKGIFSAKTLDHATGLLLKHFGKHGAIWQFSRSNETTHILDLGCGYGVVSAWIISHYAATKQSKKIILDAVDSAPLAIDLTNTNINTLLNTAVREITFHAIQSDVLTNKYFDNKEYDCILTNPPFSAGKKIVFEFIRQSFEHLRPGGQVWLVAPTNKGANSHITYTEEIFGTEQVETLALENGYRVRRGTKA